MMKRLSDIMSLIDLALVANDDAHQMTKIGAKSCLRRLAKSVRTNSANPMTTFRSWLVFLLCSASLYSQNVPVQLPFVIEDKDLIPASVHRERRSRLVQNHSEKSLIVLFSADVRNRQNDVDYEYRQNSQLLYLSGSTQAKTALLLIPGGAVIDGLVTTECFFVRARDAKRESWTGVTMGLEEARLHLGMSTVVDYDRLAGLVDTLLHGRDTLFLASGLPTSSVVDPLTTERVSIEQHAKDAIHAKHPDVYIKTVMPDLNKMREIKDSYEIAHLRKAIDISMQAHLATMQAARPGMNEYELEAVMQFYFTKGGAEDVGYPSIIGSGYNSCILHHQSNRKVTRQGDLILADCGAEYHGYTADITRTFPIDGYFSENQRAIYNIVLDAQNAGIAACRVGEDFKSSHRAATAVVRAGLLALGIIKDSSEASQYFMHGTSHYLGLDVHDVGSFGKLQPGVVMTVEPGIYIPKGSPCDPKWWNIGVRIEDDILVSAEGPINLSARLARTIDDIEKLMADARK